MYHIIVFLAQKTTLTPIISQRLDMMNSYSRRTVNPVDTAMEQSYMVILMYMTSCHI